MMNPRLTPYERHMRDLARVRIRARKERERDAIIAMCIMGIAFGISLIIMAEYRSQDCWHMCRRPRFWFWIVNRVRWAVSRLRNRFGFAAIEPADGLQAESE